MGLITGPWTLADLRAGKVGEPRNHMKVFSCFHCGGGSTMGYKLAGFDVLGGIEIDPKMMEIYRRNHRPEDRFSMLMPMQDFRALDRKYIPDELFDLDILDGSPPCSSFSMSGSREDGWGEKKKFREGQADQVLDTLFFDFIEAAERLRPKVVVAENVKGLIMGQARSYVREIFRAFHRAGYDTQLFLLNASRMGVPQARERTFFVARRRDLKLSALKMEFHERIIPNRIAFLNTKSDGKKLTDTMIPWWNKTPPGRSFSEYHPKQSFFNSKKLHPDKPSLTQTGTTRLIHWESPRMLSDSEVIRLQSFPDDYDFCDEDVQYVCGMSVPPFMTQRVAVQIRDQIFQWKPVKIKKI